MINEPIENYFSYYYYDVLESLSRNLFQNQIFDARDDLLRQDKTTSGSCHEHIVVEEQLLSGSNTPAKNTPRSNDDIKKDEDDADS